MKKVVSIFSIIGVLATVFSSYVGFLAYSQDAQAVEGNFIHVMHWKVVQALSPEGYDVRPGTLTVVPSNDEFIITRGSSVLLTNENRVPFAVRNNTSKSVTAIVMGDSRFMRVGQKEQLPNTNCYVWLHKIEGENSLFQLRCDNA